MLTLAVTVVLTGCATIRQSNARATERVLAAAGFKMHPAVTPEQQQRLDLEYVYADPTTCKCMYEGGPNEYSAYHEPLLADIKFVAGRAPLHPRRPAHAC